MGVGPMKRPVRVGFQNIGPKTWQAGVVHLQNLFEAVREFCRDEIALSYMVTYAAEFSPELANIADQVLIYPRYRRWTGQWVVNRTAVRLLGYEILLDRLLKERGIQVIAFGEAPEGSKVPSLAFLPDFQHLHLPEMFTEVECRSRDAGYLKTIQRSARVVLLSAAVRKDFEGFAGDFADKARVLNPVSAIPASIYDRNLAELTQSYTLPSKFIYFPGQFWKHKNHSRVFLALKILNDLGVHVFMAFSGYPADPRHPGYFAELLTQISKLGLRDQVAILGVPPREHTLALMRQSLCVLNPSLFEGFGMTVDEARSVGKATLLSDIPPHREQNPPRAVFFDPLDEQELAAALKQVWNNTSPGPDQELEAEARSSLPARRERYAETFMSIVREIVPQ